MKNDIRKKTCIIVRKNGEYLVGLEMGGPGMKWSISPFDAWRTRNREAAARIARITGGIMVLWNPIVNQMKVM